MAAPGYALQAKVSACLDCRHFGNRPGYWEERGASAGYAHGMTRLFHVSSVANRDSILAHGLDWTRMGAAAGIAGSAAAEVDGVFLCADEFEVGFFVGMNNSGGPVDVWAVTGVDEGQLIESGNGFSYYPAKIPPSQATLIEWPADDEGPAPRRARAKTRQRKKTPRSSH